MDYDDVIEHDKRGFCKYFGEKLANTHMIINCFFISEIIRPRSIKIAIFSYSVKNGGV